MIVTAIPRFYAISFGLLACLNAIAQEIDTSSSKLEKAKEVFSAQETAFREQITNRMEEAETRAAKTGKKDAVDLITSELSTFLKQGTLPKSVKTSDLVVKRDASYQTVIRAYKKAIEEFTKANQKFDADSAEKEMKNLEQSHNHTLPTNIADWGDKKVRIVNFQTGFVLGVANNNSKLIHTKQTENTNQLWQIKPRSEVGPYQLRNVYHDKLINVPNNNKMNGLALIIYRGQGGAKNELWNFRPVGQAFQIVSSNGLVISIAGPWENADIVQVKSTGAKQELWKMLPESPN